jgi:hypothetical protein
MSLRESQYYTVIKNFSSGIAVPSCEFGYFNLSKYYIRQYGSRFMMFYIGAIAQHDHLQMFKSIINVYKPDITILMSALKSAIESCSVNVVKYFINSINVDCYQYLLHSLGYNQIKIFKHIFKYVNINNAETIQSLLYQSVKGERYSIINFLIRQGANVNYVYNNNKNLLTSVISIESLSMIKFLMQKGFNLTHIRNLAMSEAIKTQNNIIIEYLHNLGITIHDNMNSTQK